MTKTIDKRRDSTPRMHLILAGAIALAMLWSSPALANANDRHDPVRRQQMLQQISDLKLAGLGEALGLDEAGKAELGVRLKPLEEERTALRVESYAAMKTLRNARRATDSSNGVEAALVLARNRVKLAQIDERELQEVLKGVSGEKAEKAALFMVQFPRRVEKMAGKMHKRRHGKPSDD